VARLMGSLVRNVLAVRLLVTVLLTLNGLGVRPPGPGGTNDNLYPCPYCGRHASRWRNAAFRCDNHRPPFCFPTSWCLACGGVTARYQTGAWVCLNKYRSYPAYLCPCGLLGQQIGRRNVWRCSSGRCEDFYITNCGCDALNEPHGVAVCRKDARWICELTGGPGIPRS
jgi:hypothetical protein